MTTTLILILGALLTFSPAAAAPVEAPPPAPVSSWEWPLQPRPALVRGFAVGPHPWSPGHRGVDLGAAVNQPVIAPAGGTVSFAGVVAGTPVVSIDHGGGLVSSFEPVRTRVRRGEPVAAGAVLGDLLGAGPGSHCLPGVCLHWGVRREGTYVDPLELLGLSRGPAILLPLDPVTAPGAALSVNQGGGSSKSVAHPGKFRAAA
ncbi:M23 family metallopeptidase [Kineosporia succinea]|uniref:Murein DD-endopeptidase MepM/ murein hydrolase activator NlpD n=1 Tax=Kineosporia succinea TaxID=84632 RepID=A0ABT9NWC9_9ACTN|nr:M23 family metallopeptidase [Kineosporia succinea]MDP9824722.1 murein DD-endopeptidase MepM/ murein hydrolase activator NlpD [Kineosporia succinea]